MDRHEGMMSILHDSPTISPCCSMPDSLRNGTNGGRKCCFSQTKMMHWKTYSSKIKSRRLC